MAKKPSNAFSIESDQRYRLTVSRLVVHGRTVFRPAHGYEVKGAIAAELAALDAVAELALIGE